MQKEKPSNSREAIADQEVRQTSLRLAETLKSILGSIEGLTYRRASEICGLSYTKLNLIANGKLLVTLKNYRTILPALHKLDEDKLNALYWFDELTKSIRNQFQKTNTSHTAARSDGMMQKILDEAERTMGAESSER